MQSQSKLSGFNSTAKNQSMPDRSLLTGFKKSIETQRVNISAGGEQISYIIAPLKNLPNMQP